MADHKMFDRTKEFFARLAPTRNISAHAMSLGRSLREGGRNYVSVGVLAVFVAGVTSPALLAGTDDSSAQAAQLATHAVVQDTQANGQRPLSGSATQSGGGDQASANGEKKTDEPTGGGEPAPQSGDPGGEQAKDTPAAAKKGDGGGAPAPKDDKPTNKPETKPEDPQPAQKAAPAGNQGGGEAAPAPAAAPAPEPAPAVKPVDTLDGWIRTAIDIMQAKGIPVSEAHIDEIRTVIEKESSGDPRAINLWDINAKRGTPSKGLMQTIDPTFDAYKLPGHGDIWNPVDNIIAGVRYTLSRYGSFAEHPGLESMASGGDYRGY